MLLDTLSSAFNHPDTLQNVTIGTAAASTSLITSTDLNTVKAVVISAVLSCLSQIVLTLFKKIASKLNGNNKETINPETL